MLDKFNDIQGTETENYSQELHMLYKLHEKLKYTNNAHLEINASPVMNNVENISEVSVQYQYEDIEVTVTTNVLSNDQSTMYKNDNYILPSLNESPGCHNNYEQTSTNSKTLTLSPLESCLVWPVTPERKGKRNTERTPFVITSQMWKYMHENKANKKKNIEEERKKEKRKMTNLLMK